MRVGVSRHAPAALPLGKKRGTHCTGSWAGLGHFALTLTNFSDQIFAERCPECH